MQRQLSAAVEDRRRDGEADEVEGGRGRQGREELHMRHVHL